MLSSMTETAIESSIGYRHAGNRRMAIGAGRGILVIPGSGAARLAGASPSGVGRNGRSPGGGIGVTIITCLR